LIRCVPALRSHSIERGEIKKTGGSEDKFDAWKRVS
jgi:hypothetical protein